MGDYSGACTIWSFIRVMGFVWPIFLLYINENEGTTNQNLFGSYRNGSEASLIFDMSQLLSPNSFFSFFFFSFFNVVYIGSSQKPFHESQLSVLCKERENA